MKKISGWFYCRPLGEYNYEFFVEDNATEEEIKEKILNTLGISYDYNVDEGYEAVVETVYRKNNENLHQDNNNTIIRYACTADIIDMMNCEKKHCDKCVYGKYHPIEVIK